MKLIIENGTIVNENRTFKGSIVIDNGHISEVVEDAVSPRSNCDERIDATGCFVLPGVIDSHVHFREPGLTEKADIESESRAAAFGGVTIFSICRTLFRRQPRSRRFTTNSKGEGRAAM